MEIILSNSLGETSFNTQLPFPINGLRRVYLLWYSLKNDNAVADDKGAIVVGIEPLQITQISDSHLMDAKLVLPVEPGAQVHYFNPPRLLTNPQQLKMPVLRNLSVTLSQPEDDGAGVIVSGTPSLQYFHMALLVEGTNTPKIPW